MDSLFNGLQEKHGIRNDEDPYTEYGDIKDFEELHYEETLENVVEAMRQQGEVGVGVFGMKDIIGSSARKYNSIADIKADKGRLGTVDADAYDAQRQEFSHRFFELGDEFAKKTDAYDDGTDARNILVEAVENGRTREEIARYLKKEGKGFTNYSEAIVDKLIALRDDIASMPTEYFEAKPQRAVGFEEIKAVVLPKDTPQGLKNALAEKGIPTTEYDGTDEGRIAAVNSAADVTDARFELKDPDDIAYRSLEKANTRLEKRVAALKQELKRTNGMIVKDGEAKRAAAKIVDEYSSGYDKQTLTENLQKTFDFFAGKQADGKTGLEHLDEAMPQLRALAKDVINKSSEPIAELEEFYKPIRDMIRTTKITPTAQQKAEIADWGSFVRENRGKIAIAKEGGTTVKSLYKQLAEADPTYFESGISEEDMLQAIADYVNDVAAPEYVNPFGENLDEAIDGLANEMLVEYLTAPKLKTFADKKFEEKQAALKKQGEALNDKISDLTATVKGQEAALKQLGKENEKLGKTNEKLGEKIAGKENAIKDLRTTKNAKIDEIKKQAVKDKRALREDLKERQKRKAVFSPFVSSDGNEVNYNIEIVYKPFFKIQSRQRVSYSRYRLCFYPRRLLGHIKNAGFF